MTIHDEAFEALAKLVVKMNKVTARWRHQKQTRKDDMDALCNAQLDAEAILAQKEEAAQGERGNWQDLLNICQYIVKDQYRPEVLPSLIAELSYQLSLTHPVPAHPPDGGLRELVMELRRVHAIPKTNANRAIRAEGFRAAWIAIDAALAGERQEEKE